MTTGSIGQTNLLDEILVASGMSASGMAVTAVLYVSPNGDNTDGKTWPTAFQTIQAALDAASVDTDDLTLILISPHTTNYDINTTGDPTWAANVILKGSYRNWAKVKNTHATATSIMKLTGKASVESLNFNLGSGSGNGLIMTHGGFRVYDCQFVGEDLTGAATALWFDHATGGKHGIAEQLDFLGHITHMTGMLVDQFNESEFVRLRVHYCLTGIQIVGATSTDNQFRFLDIGECVIGIDIDAGDEQHLEEVIFHRNTTNIDDEVGGHILTGLYDSFPITTEPDNLVGVTVPTHFNAATWGADTEVRAAATSTKPFRIVGAVLFPSRVEKFRIRFSADSGSTFYDDVLFDATKAQSAQAPSGTESIFNAGTRISASAQSVTGNESVIVWLKIQEI